jgi:hypothetical protein
MKIIHLCFLFSVVLTGAQPKCLPSHSAAEIQIDTEKSPND